MVAVTLHHRHAKVLELSTHARASLSLSPPHTHWSIRHVAAEQRYRLLCQPTSLQKGRVA
jgi:hypothetical protein